MLLLSKKVLKMRVNISLAKSTSIGYRLKIEMATDRVCLHFKINSLIHEKYYPNAIYQCRIIALSINTFMYHNMSPI